ncbi:MAG TPA: YggU family protein [Syntrophobacteraceae bacterium]|nr:YggU family protein [Syntrophobacteraceae bacterium]
MDCIQERAEGVVVRVRVQPRSSRNELAGVQQGALKLRLTAPPVEGAANEECLRFLAKLLEVPQTRLRMIKGHKSRQKVVLIADANIESIRLQLQRHGLD